MYVWVAWASFLSWLSLHYSRLGVLTQIWFADAPLLVTDLCASEPTVPAFPAVTTWALAMVGDGIAALEVGNYLRELFVSTVWDTVCECAPDPSGGVCTTGWTPSFSWNAPHSTGGNSFALGTVFNMGGNYPIYAADTWFPTAPNGSTVHIVVWNKSTSTLAFQEDFAYAGSGYRRYTFSGGPHTLTGGETYAIYFDIAASTNIVDTSTAPTNGACAFTNKCYDIGFGGHCDSVSGTWNPIAPVICVGGPPPGDPGDYTPPAPQDPTDIPDNPNPPCSTTADLCSATTRILAAVATAERQINWVQSALAPNCWIPGTIATGLTGSGTLAVSDIVGLFADCSVPTRWGKTSEAPPRFIPEIGSVEFTTDGVVTARYGLHYAQENVIRGVPSNNGIRYNIRGGVVASITPLHRCK